MSDLEALRNDLEKATLAALPWLLSRDVGDLVRAVFPVVESFLASRSSLEQNSATKEDELRAKLSALAVELEDSYAPPNPSIAIRALLETP